MSNTLTMIYVPGEAISVVLGSGPVTISSAHPNFNAAVDAAKKGDGELFATLANIPASIAKFSAGKIEVDVKAGQILYAGTPLNNYLCDIILRMMEEGFQVSPLVNFLDNLMSNPSYRAVTELYGFLEFGKMPITPDGHFLAYKRVRGDYRSVYDAKTDNSIGSTVSMTRNQVNEDSDQTCSRGLHFCSIEYIRQYSGDKIVVVKINPRDVVAIPRDYNNTKGRACEYVVVGELTEEEFEAAVSGTSKWKTVVVADYNDRDTDLDGDVSSPSNVTPDIFADLSDDQRAMVAEYEAGYRAGYKAGRGKLPHEADLRGLPPELWVGDYQSGYTDGHKDGKAHKPKKVK